MLQRPACNVSEMFLTVPSRTSSGDSLPLTPPLDWFIHSPAPPSSSGSDQGSFSSGNSLAMNTANVLPTIEKDDIVKTEIMSRPDKNNFCTLKFPVQHRPRATRASVPKVRTGCITCKRRHVKCDEDKPGCQRCLRWQGHCDGYEVIIPKKCPTRPSSSSGPVTKITKRAASASSKHSRSNSSVSSTASNSCMPSPATPSFSVLATPAPSPGELTVLPTPMTPAFVVPTAIPSPPPTALHPLDAWLMRISTLSTHLSTHPFWQSTLPILSASHAGIRLALRAVAAMTHARTSGCDPCAHESALENYGAALAELACAPSAGTTSNLRAAVLCCLLFASFESMSGDRSAALAHVQNGMRMLDELSRLGQERQQHLLQQGVTDITSDEDQLDGEMVVLFYAFTPDTGADVVTW